MPDHRLEYLTYEGPVSGGRGTVTRWDEGQYVAERQDDGLWVVVLQGKKLRGRATLRRLEDQGDGWEFSMEME